MASNETYRLVMRRGPQPNQVYELTKDITNIGRDITNDIVVNDREASRHHLRILRNPDGFVIEDLGSTNGTFINGKRLSGSMPLKNGDMVGLGETVTFGFESVGSPGFGASPSSSSSPAASNPPSSSPFQQPAPQPQPAYQQPAASNEPLQAEYQPPQQGGDVYAQQPAYSPPGYDYDPYAMREEEGSSSRWIILGCFVFVLLGCICISVVGLVVIDQLNLWCEFPVVSNIVGAFGYCGA